MNIRIQSKVNQELAQMNARHESDISLRSESENSPARPLRQSTSSTIILEYKIDGMTCVNCSSAIENGMKNLYKDKGLVEAQIALLTHKMRITFNLIKFNENEITAESVAEEVECIGFGAELLETIINDQAAMMNNDITDFDIEHGGHDQERILNKPQNSIKVCSLIVEGMTCSSCQLAIENHLKSVAGVVTASVSLLTHKCSVQYKANEVGIRNLIEEIQDLGYMAKFEAKQDKSDIRLIVNEAVTKYKRKFFLALALQIPILILNWIIAYAVPSFVTAYHNGNGVPLFVWLNAGFATVIQVVMGAQFYVNSYKSLRHKSANMDVLIMMGTTSAWGYGIVLCGIGYKPSDMMDMNMFKEMIVMHAHNFEISSVLITIILLGKFLESITKKKTVDKLAQLASLKVTKAFLIDYKHEEDVSINSVDKECEVELLQVNDLIKVYPGGGVPVDGVIIYGKGSINEAMLTGEARLIQKEIGSKVFGGTILIQGNIIVKVAKTAENSSINQIIKMVENAQNARAPIQGLADRISRHFVPIIILLSCATWVFWFSYAYSNAGKRHIELNGQTRFQFAFNFGISTLVIACPCALGLATPTAVMVGTGVAATYGILIKGGDVLEKINSITTIVFDKTGTLTSGSPLVRDIISIKEHFKLEEATEDKDLLMYFTYVVEKASEHPLAKAVVKKMQSLIPSKIEEYGNQYILQDFKNWDGEGVSATLLEKNTGSLIQVHCGNDKLMKHHKVTVNKEIAKNVDLLEQEGLTVVQLAFHGVPQMIVTLEETHLAKPEAREVVTFLKEKMKMKVAMITGDNQHAAYKVARHVGIDIKDVVYKAYPEDKKKAVEKFQADGHKVMFVGDGINDSPVLAQAEVGVAINSASDITVNAADIVLMKDSLYDVVNAVRISKASFSRIKTNFVWAFMYNILLVPIAMGFLYPIHGFKLDPIYAGAAMALSSISVVLSSLLLKCFRPTFNLTIVQSREAAAAKNKNKAKGLSDSIMTNQSEQQSPPEVFEKEI